MRPACMIWMKIRPPLSCTAAVTFFQPGDMRGRVDAWRREVALAVIRKAECLR